MSSQLVLDSPTALIYHMLPQTAWEALPAGSPYAAGTLADEGFVHCTGEPSLLETVANRFYRQEPGAWLILVLAVDKLTAPVRWEAADGQLFPHVYGPIDREAVVNVVSFPRSIDGGYHLPEDFA